MNKKTIKDLDVKGKKVLVRVDFNVPLDDRRNITDDRRIVSALPTIRYLLDHGAAVILMSHLGRPKGKPEPEYSLEPVAVHLSELLKQPVKMTPDCIGPEVRAVVAAMKPGDIVLLENLRFHNEETKNDAEFARELASLAELYVNDAFGTAHRAHASTEGVTRYLPGVAGFLMEKELDFLGTAVESPEHPFVAILGGAKISDKIGVIDNLLGKVDKLIIGGGMANTFLKAQGYDVADSLAEDDSLDNARTLLKQGGDKLVLPVDVVVADSFANDAKKQVVKADAVPAGWRILDIGPDTVKLFSDIVKSAKTVVWNGPMGVFEFPEFAKGTFALAHTLANTQAVTIIGGGDSAAAIEQAGLADKITHISTGGGASLEFLEGKTLPGVAALADR